MTWGLRPAVLLPLPHWSPQASALLQHCMQLQAATAALEEQHTQLLKHHQQQQQQQRQQQQASLTTPSPARETAAVSDAALQPLADLALQLQGDLELLSSQHKALAA